MNSITGTVKNGVVILDEPAEIRDGSRVVVQPLECIRQQKCPTTWPASACRAASIGD